MGVSRQEAAKTIWLIIACAWPPPHPPTNTLQISTTTSLSPLQLQAAIGLFILITPHFSSLFSSSYSPELFLPWTWNQSSIHVAWLKWNRHLRHLAGPPTVTLSSCFSNLSMLMSTFAYICLFQSCSVIFLLCLPLFCLVLLFAVLLGHNCLFLWCPCLYPAHNVIDRPDLTQAHTWLWTTGSSTFSYAQHVSFDWEPSNYKHIVPFLHLHLFIIIFFIFFLNFNPQNCYVNQWECRALSDIPLQFSTTSKAGRRFELSAC